jgi:PAS domain S-box-containing protein
MKDRANAEQMNPNFLLAPDASHDPASDDLRSNQIIHRLVRVASRVLGAPFSGVSIIERERQIVFGSGSPDSGAALPRSLTARGYGRHAIESGEPLLVEDVRAHPGLPALPGGGDDEVVSFLAVPLGSEAHPMSGVLCVGHHEPRRWSQNDVAVLTDLSALAAAEISRSSEHTDLATTGVLSADSADRSASILDISERKRAEARGAAAEAHYRRLVGSMPQAVYVLDRNGHFVEINPAAERILMRPAEDLLGAGFQLVISPGSRQAVEEKFADVISGRANDIEFETFIRRPSGEKRLLAIMATAIAENGRITGLHGIARDVTEEREQQNALLESEETFRQIAEHVKEAYWVCSPDFSSTLYISPVYEQITGRPVSATGFDENDFFNWLHPDDLDRFREAMNELRYGVAASIEHRILRPDGTIRRVLGRGYPIRDSKGAVYRIIGTAEDVTEEREREARQRLLVTALDGLAEGVCLLTSSGEFKYLNRTYRTILGIPDGEWENARITDFAPDAETRQWQMARLQEVMQHGSWRGRVQRRRLEDGELVLIDVTLGRVAQSGGAEDLIFGIIRDATVEVSREQHLRRVERLASVVTLVGGVAHELNNPLNSVLNFAQLLAMDEPDPERREDLDTIRREAERMARVVSDLRQVARSVREERQEKTVVDLNEVITHVLKVQEFRLRSSNIEVEVELDGSRPLVLADRSQLEQVLINLVANAEHAMVVTAAEGRLAIRSRATGSGVDLLVEDSGPGIAAGMLDRIFDPFFTTKSPGEGMGLGLSLVHSVVATLGGQIHVTSELGSGTIFRIDLPRAAEVGRDTPETPCDPDIRALRVLIVDDEPAIRRVLTRYLSRRGHAVDEASEGAAALRMIESSSYDVILTDLRMPGMGGEELLEKLRGRAIDVRLVFMTGDAGGGATGLELQVPLLHKPLDLEAVVRVVEKR